MRKKVKRVDKGNFPRLHNIYCKDNANLDVYNSLFTYKNNLKQLTLKPPTALTYAGRTVYNYGDIRHVVVLTLLKETFPIS